MVAAKQELRGDVEALALPSVEKLKLYREGPEPADLNNWLLKVPLAHGEFRTDQVAIWRSELELGLEFTAVMQAYAEFFQTIKRKDDLKRLLKADNTARQHNDGGLF